MAGKFCKICKSSESAGVILFNAPKEAHRRDAWTASCGLSITKNSFVCQKHFSDKDLYGKKTTKLKVDALPLPMDNNTKWQPETVLAIKAEPPEFVQVNDSITYVEFTPEQSAAFNIKEEPIEPFTFINEECFDENSENPIRTNDDGNNDVTAGSNGQRTSTCGRIVVDIASNGSQSFRLQCIYCRMIFRAPNSSQKGEDTFWPLFIQHLNTSHSSEILPPPEKTSIDANVVIEQQKGTENVATGENINETECGSVSKTIFGNFDKQSSKQKDETEVDLDDNKSEVNEDVIHNYEDSDNGNESCEDETYEPNPKKRRRSNNTANSKSTEVKKSDEILTFDHPEKSYVITFLELLKSHAILWHPRQSIMKRSDEALGSLSVEFSARCPNSTISKEQLRQSINRIKDLYHRVSDESHPRRMKISMYKLKYPEYFQLCDEIEEESKNIKQTCNICERIFYSEIDLQIHKVKRHRIGELPFKCQRCFYAFACPEKLASHEAKHNRSKTFKCEICDQSFFYENKLQAHMVLHTDDSKQICEICGKKFPSLSKYRRHKLHHEDPKEKCEVCGKLYFEKWTLSEHMKSHRNERHYKCDICGKTFNRQEGVTIHKRGVHKIKTQTKKYVWVNRVTSATSTETGSQNENLTAGETHNSNSNSSSLSSTTNETTTTADVKPPILNNTNTNYHSNMISFDVLNSLLN